MQSSTLIAVVSVGLLAGVGYQGYDMIDSQQSQINALKSELSKKSVPDQSKPSDELMARIEQQGQAIDKLEEGLEELYAARLAIEDSPIGAATESVAPAKVSTADVVSALKHDDELLNAIAARVPVPTVSSDGEVVAAAPSFQREQVRAALEDIRAEEERQRELERQQQQEERRQRMEERRAEQIQQMVTQLELQPYEAEQFKTILQTSRDNRSLIMEQMRQDGADRTQIREQFEAARAEEEAQLKALLGEEGYTKYESLSQQGRGGRFNRGGGGGRRGGRGGGGF